MSTTLKEVLEQVCAEDYALPEKARGHVFSRKHRKAVNEIIYHDNEPKSKKRLPLKLRVPIIAAAVLAAGLAMGAASVIRYGGFTFSRHDYEGYRYYQMLAENASDAPQTIEKHVYTYTMPEKYKRIDKLCHEFDDHTIEVYVDQTAEVPENMGKPMVQIQQYTKKAWFTGVEVGVDEIVPIEIHGCNGVKFTHPNPDSDHGGFNAVCWDHGDYICNVGGTVPMDEIIAIAESMTEI